MPTIAHIRNIAIIAHVDHGKTTLVDQLLRQGGAFRENQQVAERAMDSMDLEREKGITIKAKNTSVHWRDYIINIVDTPGHADFGGEVERVMKMVDGVLLLVDAYDGPQAQTRFVLRKALQQGLRPVVVINKIDRDNSDPHKVHDQVLELLMELEATEEQFNCPFIYGSAKNGFMVHDLNDERKDMIPLFETIVEAIHGPEAEPEQPFKMLVSNIDWNDYVGRVAVGKVASGRIQAGDQIYVFDREGNKKRTKITKIFTYSGLATSDSLAGEAGDIIGLAGFEDVDIGVTLAADETAEPLPFVEIDPPTISMMFAVNDGPLAGQDGKYVTSRQIRDRLAREQKINISLRISDGEFGGTFEVVARGAMQVAVLVETMRREGYEVLVSRPKVITRKDEQGNTLEPYETLWVETPDDCLGGILKSLAGRKARIDNMINHKLGTTVECYLPTRGLIGFEFDLMNLTSGRAVMSHLFKDYGNWAGEINTRLTGTLVSMDTGEATGYSLMALQERGKLFVGPGDMVYEGMVVGENPRKEEIPVNPTKAKKLDNMRASGRDDNVQLAPALRFSLERALEYIAGDEFVEATPNYLRLRKRILNSNERRKAEKREAALNA
ncbi:MAG: translational GTPase TypA [Verrucomicrobiota bacterium JB022]|nr:translational GTPase TypA [Verrucomicrobiota bacterium JB022]